MRRAVLTVATWDTWWASSDSVRGHRVAALLMGLDADLIVVTEGTRELLPPTGHTVDAGSHWGGRNEASRRKVIVWSTVPLTVEFIADEGAARGRLAVAILETPDGPVRVVGVCIPWDGSKVSPGPSGVTKWSEHLQYLDQIESVLATLDDRVPTIIAGDFNQKIPRVRQPVRVAARLHDVLEGWAVHTAGDDEPGPHIDHIATSAHFVCDVVSAWPRHDAEGTLSDHTGVSCQLRLKVQE